jgi:PPOX class probable F420-dependent enzyme
MVATELAPAVREILAGPGYWHLATLNADGSPQVTTVCTDLRQGQILISTLLDRQKARNMERDARVALSWCDPGRPTSHIAIQGRVVARYEGAAAEADIDAITRRYAGRPHVPGDGERRVSYLIAASRVVARWPG